MHMRDRGSAQYCGAPALGTARAHDAASRAAVCTGSRRSAKLAHGYYEAGTLSPAMFMLASPEVRRPGAAKGASVGASVGSVIPVIGTAVGGDSGRHRAARLLLLFPDRIKEIQNFDQASAIYHAQGRQWCCSTSQQVLGAGGLV